MQLRQFIGDFNTSQTLPADYGLVSADNGKGLREGIWRIFLSPSALQSRTRVLRKRRRLSSSVEPDNVTALPRYNDALSRTPPPYSPTEIATPSQSPALSLHTSSFSMCPFAIKPTLFKAAPAAPSLEGALLASKAESVAQDGPPKNSREPADDTLQIDCRTEERIQALVKDMFTTEVEARLGSVVERVLPRLTEQAYARMIDPLYDQLVLHRLRGCRSGYARESGRRRG